MENSNKINEINNPRIEKLLIDKISEIYKVNQTRFLAEGIDLADIGMAKIGDKIIYEVIEVDREGNNRKSFYDGNANYILTDSSKYGKPIFSSKGIGNELSKDFDKVDKFLSDFENNKEISEIDIKNNKMDKARVDAISKHLNVDSDKVDITEYSVDDMKAAKLKVDNIDSSKIAGEFKGNQAITQRDTFNSILGGNYQKVLFVKVGDNSVMPYGVNEKDELMPIQLKVFPGGQYKTNVIDRDGMIRQNVTQTGIYISGKESIDEGLSVNLDQFGKFEVTYTRDMMSKNPIGAVIKDSRAYNNDQMMKLVDRYYTSQKEIEEDNKMLNSPEKRDNNVIKADLIATDSEIYLKNGVFDPEVSRKLYYELKGDMEKFNSIVDLAKSNVIDSKEVDPNELINEYEKINKNLNGKHDHGEITMEHPSW